MLIDESAQKRIENPSMVKTSRNAKKTKNGEKSKSTTVFQGKKKCLAVKVHGLQIDFTSLIRSPGREPGTGLDTGRAAEKEQRFFSLL